MSEEATLAWFRELDYPTLHGADLALGEPQAERETDSGLCEKHACDRHEQR